MYRYVDIAGLYICVQHIYEALLPTYLLFLIHDVQEPERLSSKVAFEPQVVFWVTPRFLEDVDFIACYGFDVNFRNKFFYLAIISFFEN